VADPTLEDLLERVVVLRDRRGHGARYVVDHVHGDVATCSYAFRGRHVPVSR